MAKKLAKLSTGIYRDQYSIRAIVHIAAGRTEKRFDFDTPLKDIKQWRNVTRVKLETKHPQRRAGMMGRGSFSADVKRHIKTLAIKSWKSRRSELRAWEKHVGPMKRRRVTSDHVKKVIKAWVDAGIPAKTIVNRVRGLTAMYHDLDGPDAWTPADAVAVPKPAKRIPVHVSVSTIRSVEARLREQADPLTHARYMVLASTGARPVHLKRAKVADVDLDQRIWNIPGAKGGNPIELWLNDDMVAAWKTFIDAEAWGDFDATEYAKAVRAAGWPEGVPPYNAKHSFGKDLGEAGIDLETIADWFGQTDTKTARIYTGALPSKLRAASEAINGRLGWGQGPTKKHSAGRLANMTAKQRNAKIGQLLEELQALVAPGS